MARRENSLFIGKEHLNLEGRSIKHPSLIKIYATPNVNKVNDEEIKLLGLDLETNHLTAELKLLGFYNGIEYQYFTEGFIEVLYLAVKNCLRNDASMAYWNRLDPFVLFKQFLILKDETEQMESLNRFGKVSGEWDRKNGKWKLPPLVSVQVGGHEFGIINVVRSSIQFYILSDAMEKPKTCWAFDIAALYQSGLEKEATARFDWYSKVDKSAHLVDWVRFEKDDYYRNEIVLKSNKYDAMAVYYLGLHIQNDFKKAFEWYPRTLVSQGSLARSAIVAVLIKSYEHIEDDEERKALIYDDMASMGLLYHLDNWVNDSNKEDIKDFYSLCTEAYSGGYIESIHYGYSADGYYADIASAYPGVIQHLLDLRGSTITKGVGIPPKIDNGYVFIRGDVSIPVHVQYHPITIKHPILQETNIRAVGEYRASYIYQEREFLIEQGATFENEEYFIVETKGEISPLAKVCMQFIDLRTQLKAQNDSAEHMAKIAANSLYGILFEAVDTFEEITKEVQVKETHTDAQYREALKPYLKAINLEAVKKQIKITYDNDYAKIIGRWHNKDAKLTLDMVKMELEETHGLYLEASQNMDILHEINSLYEVETKQTTTETIEQTEIIRSGYRAGEFWNPLYATIITAMTRLLLAKASTAIEDKGGKPIIMMTDSVLWQGTAEMLPNELWREKKTLGFFEKPEYVKDIICLGSGRYGYTAWDKKSKSWVRMSKKRGLNASEIHSAEGIPLDDFNWADALKVMDETKSEKIHVTVRVLVSPGMILHNHNYKVIDLGKVVEETREVDVVVGKSKRSFDDDIKNPKLLATTLVPTESLVLGYNMFGDGKIPNQTLSFLRNHMMRMNYMTRKDKRQQTDRGRQKKYYHNVNGKQKKDKKNDVYEKLRAYGYPSKYAKIMCNWANKRIDEQLAMDRERGLIQ